MKKNDRVIVVLSRVLARAINVIIPRKQMEMTGIGIGRVLNSPARYSLAVAAETALVAIPSRRVSAAPIKAAVLPQNCKR